MKKINKIFKLILSSIIVFCLVSTLSACTKNAKDDSDATFTKARVTRVTDGDTISVNINGGDYKIRMVGVDTPETVHPNKPVEYYGKEASNFTKKQLTGKTIYLQKDVSDTDKYGRLLRYIWLEKPQNDNPSNDEIKNKMYNAILVKEGYAYVYTYQPDIRYNNLFRQLQADAREGKIGLWSDPSQTKEENSRLTTKKNLKKNVENNKNSKENINDSTNNNNKKIKGNKNSKVYHIPGSRSYNTIKESNTIYFDSEKDAKDAGYRKAQN